MSALGPQLTSRATWRELVTLCRRVVIEQPERPRLWEIQKPAELRSAPPQLTLDTGLNFGALVANAQPCHL